MKTKIVKAYIKESIDLHVKIFEDSEFLEDVSSATKLLTKAMKSGKKLLIAGNGGSAADAQHFAAEFVGRYKLERKGYPAISLATDTSILTAWANDYSYDTVFARQIESLGNKGDVFLGISTSGNSKNILYAVEKATEKGMHTICFLGKDGGQIKDRPDVAIVVPSDNTPRIQEVHTLLLHIISEEVERALTIYDK